MELTAEQKAFLDNVISAASVHLDSYRRHAEDIFPGMTLAGTLKVDMVQKIPTPASSEDATPAAPPSLAQES